MRSEAVNFVSCAFLRQRCVFQQPGPPLQKQLQPTNKKKQINTLHVSETRAQNQGLK